MRRILICTGVLGGGTALTFAAAALAATLLPGGTVLSTNPVFLERSFAKPAFPVPAPMPMPIEPDVMVELPAGQTWSVGSKLDGPVEALPER
jgi:hypothetical protein